MYKNFLWTKTNKVKLSQNVNRDNNVLRINNFNEDNEGVYECAFENEQKNSLTLSLRIKSKYFKFKN